MKFENCYISSNCNQTPTSAHWGKNNLICYASCNAVMIYDPNSGSGGKVTDTLIKHTKRVNSVRWLSSKTTTYEKELISASTDSNVIIWSLKVDQYHPIVLSGHSSNVNIVDGLYKEDDFKNTIVISVSMDCTVKIWQRIHVEDNFSLAQNIELGYSVAVGIKLFLTNDAELILTCALDNSNIQIYTERSLENQEVQFETSASLLGHEDWVRGFDFANDGSDILLASCSQDGFIRLWRLTEQKTATEGDHNDYEIKSQSQIKTLNKTYNVYLESVLAGHDNWIYSVNWNPNSLQLLSASIDKSMIIWEFDQPSQLWLEKIRVGEVGGNTLGFYGGVFGPDGNRILAHSYHGAFHIWTFSDKLLDWQPSVTVGGHFSEVVDCAWEPKGEFLYSVSSDQSTRIHAPWQNKKEIITWHEIARPQVHGYDMSSLAVISRYKFASGAEEKVIRTFQAPANFVDNFRRLCHIENDVEGDSIGDIKNVGPKGASVPSLGLSNKAVYTDNNIDQASSVDKRNPYPEESHFTATDLIEPPTEETLLQNTLWPEVQKLYGHGYEVYCLAASPDGKYLASACKSTKPEHSAVLLWDTSSWKQIQKLMSHTLTVVQIQFSPDSKHLLSVSRDRRWSLFTKNNSDEFELAATTDKKTSIHSRIIWTCTWTHDSKYFATGSRDGKVVVWNVNSGKPKTTILGEVEAVSTPLEFKNESVTALAFAPDLIAGSYLISIGLESGIIHFNLWNLNEWKKVSVFSNSIGHHLAVKRLAFRPVFGKAGDKSTDTNILQLASCSLDYSVHVYNIFKDSIQN